MIASLTLCVIEAFLLIDCPAQFLEMLVLVWFVAESLLNQGEELSDTLDEGFFDEHSSLLIDIILICKVIHGQSWLDVTVVQIVGNVWNKSVLGIDNIFARWGVSLILHMMEEHDKVSNKSYRGQRLIRRNRKLIYVAVVK